MLNQIAKTLKLQYILFWILPILIVIGYETDLIMEGRYADDVRMQYILETIGILTAIVCVPLALKLFSIVLKKKIDEAHFEQAVRKYIIWCGVRLFILEVAVVLNLVVYYLTLNNVGVLCALIALTASMFCLPGEKRLREDLYIAKD